MFFLSHNSLGHSIFFFFVCFFVSCIKLNYGVALHLNSIFDSSSSASESVGHLIKSRSRTSRRSDRLGIDNHLGRMIREKRHSMKSRRSSHSTKNRWSSHSTKSRRSSHSTKSRGRTSRRSDRLGIDSHLGRIHEKRHSMKSRWRWRRLAKANLESMAWKQR